MPKLNKNQQEAVEYTDSPLLIVAGAGTGKTTVITQKIAYLVENNLAKPEEILALTFTDKAAAEMEDRVDSTLNTSHTEMQISTFHTFCQKVLEEHGLDIGLPNRFKLLTETDAWLLVKQNLSKFELDYYRPIGNPARHIHELLKHFSKCKDELIAPEDYIKYAEDVQLENDDVHTDERSRLKEVANAYHTYNHLLLEKQAMDFGDLIFYTVKLLKERAGILSVLQKSFKYILVDEFQDVNYAQYELVKLLANNKTKESIPQLTVVGDDDQSIYAFRGASVSNILQFKEDFTDAKEIVLTDNYRSGQKILDHAYKLIQHNNPDRLETKLNINKKLKSNTKGQISKVSHKHYLTLDEEVDFVIKEIPKIKKDFKLTWDDIAILVRANNHADPFMERLEQLGIPYEFLTSSGLHRQPIVVDCFSIFKSFTNYYDNFAIYSLLTLPFFNLSEHDIQFFTRAARKKSLPYYELLQSARGMKMSDSVSKVCERLKGLIDNGVKRSKFEKPTTVLLEFLQDSGYLTWLTKQAEEGSSEALRSVRHLKQFFDFVDQYQRTNPKASVFGFVDYYEQVLASGEDGRIYQPSDTPDSVNIMTVHASKGLEFKCVFLVNCVSQRFPSMRRKDGIEIPAELIKQELPEGDYHEQEERRLFYVAMTRAKEQLYVTSADFYGDAKRKKKLSQFVEESGMAAETISLKSNASPSELASVVSNSPKVRNDNSDLSTHFYEIPKTFSFSQIRAFQVCPYQYKLAYLLQIPTRQSHYFSFGNTMHLTLQRFYEEMQNSNSAKQTSLFDSPTGQQSNGNSTAPPTLNRLLELYEENWISDWYQSKNQRESYYKKGRDILKDYYEKHNGNWSIPAALEKGFKMKLGDFLVTGKIDRVDADEKNNLHIIDYKTGKTKEKISGSDKEQLLLYQLATLRTPFFRNLGNTNKLTYYYLNDGVETSFLGTNDELEKFENKIIETIKKITETDWSKITRKNGCGRCEYCEAIGR